MSMVVSKYYYDYRSCSCHPIDNTTYLTSSQYFRVAITRSGLAPFRKKILLVYITPKAAIAHKIFLPRFNMKDHPTFFNQANQRGGRFSVGWGLLSAVQKNNIARAQCRRHLVPYISLYVWFLEWIPR